MTISAQVQQALDKATQAVTLEQSVALASQAQGAQISALNQKIADLQKQIADGSTLSADDIAGLATIGQDLDTVNSSLQSIIPANVQPTTGGTAPPPTASS